MQLPEHLPEHYTLEANRKAATRTLLEEGAPKAKSFYQHLLTARQHSIVLLDDAQLLNTAMQAIRKDYGSDRIAHELWYFSLLEGKPHSFDLLSRLSSENDFRFPLVEELDKMPEAYQLWAMDIASVRTMWLSKTELVAAREGVRLVNGLNVLQENESTAQLRASLDAKPDAFHARMRLFIAESGMNTLMVNGAFLHTIAYYQEPTKKHVRVAATGTNPVYDLPRMNQHWPGIGDALNALSSLGLPVADCQARIRQTIANKQKTALGNEVVELPSNFTLG